MGGHYIEICSKFVWALDSYIPIFPYSFVVMMGPEKK
jgi:hypothetical protein